MNHSNNFNSKHFLVVLIISQLFLAVFSCQVWAAYTSSSHGDNTNGVSRKDMATAGYAAGNCAHCHEQHASVEGNTNAADPGIYLGFDNEEKLCLSCHDGTTVISSSIVTDINTDAIKDYGHGVGPADNKIMATEFNVHRYDETLPQAGDGAHVECTDCHNPHEAQGTTRTAGTTGNAIPATSVIREVNGATPSTWPTWATPAGGIYNLQTATKEYEICFKCHSSANADISNWDGAGAASWTDVALEFNPANASLHPISTGLTAATNTNALDVAQLVAPWNTPANIGVQTMYCTDCHESNSSVAGPHGSAVKWMLAGARKAWPYYNNGSGTTFNGTSNTDANRNNVVYWSLGNETSGSGDDRIFCRNCHPTPAGDHHTEGGHRGSKSGGGDGSDWYLACVDCHIRVPHGGKVRRLIAADSYPAGGNMPNRYYPDGDSGDKINRGDGANLGPLENFDYVPGYPGTQYDTNNCGAGCYSDHNYSGTAADEQW